MLILWVRKCEYGVLEITRDTKVLSNHSSSTRDLRLLYHLWFPKPHTHISYSQYFHNVAECKKLLTIKILWKSALCNVRRNYWRPWMMLMTFAISPKKCHVIVDINAPGKNYWLRRKPFSETHIFWLLFPFFHYSTQQSNPQISRQMCLETHFQHEFSISAILSSRGCREKNS